MMKYPKMIRSNWRRPEPKFRASSTNQRLCSMCNGKAACRSDDHQNPRQRLRLATASPQLSRNSLEHPRSILVPLDGSAFAEHALPYAMAIAPRLGASIEIFHVHYRLSS